MNYRYIAEIRGQKHCELLGNQTIDAAFNDAIELTKQLGGTMLTPGTQLNFELHSPDCPINPDPSQTTCTGTQCISAELNITAGTTLMAPDDAASELEEG